MNRRAKEIAAEFSQSLIEFSKRLIQTPSLPGNEAAVSELFLEEMRTLGYDEVFRDHWGNVVGIVRGTLPGSAILYNGHMDHVEPGDLQEWEGYDPYGGSIDECLVFDRKLEKEELIDTIHGRGSADMKCGGASQVYTGGILARLKKEGYPVAGTFIAAMVVLEENGEMLGMIKLLDETFVERGITFDGMINGEPSSLNIILGHRGRVELKVTVYGESCHGSSPWLGVNAVTKAAKLILEVEKTIWSNGREDAALGKSGIALTIIECEPAALCIVPDKCHITYDRRLVPGETVEGAIAEIEGIISELAREDPQFRAEVRVNSAVRRAYTGETALIESKKEVWAIQQNHPFVAACAKGLLDAGQNPNFGYWSFSTDIPAVGVRKAKPVIGYSGLQEYYIHRPIERVRLDYLQDSLVGNVCMFLSLTGGVEKERVLWNE